MKNMINITMIMVLKMIDGDEEGNEDHDVEDD